MNSCRQAAFTLIEIMVALFVIAITMAAILENTGATSRNALYLKQKTIAGWVASNQIALIRAKREWDNRKKRSGTEEMAGQEWQWTMFIENTEDDSIRKVTVEVALAIEPENILGRMTGFLGKL